MDRKQIAEIVAAEGPKERTAEEFREALNAVEEDDALLLEAQAELSASVLAGDAAKARDARERIAFANEQRRLWIRKLKGLLAEAEEREGTAALTQDVDRVRKLQHRSLEVGAELHDAAQKLARLLAEQQDITAQIRAHNARMQHVRRSDLVLAEPMELLGRHLRVFPGLLPQPEEWQIDGYWPKDPEARRLDGFAALVAEKPRKRAA